MRALLVRAKHHCGSHRQGEKPLKRIAALWIGIVCLLAACGGSGMDASMPGMKMEMPMPGPHGAPAAAHTHGNDAIAHYSVAMEHYLPGENAAVTILIQDRWNRPIDQFDRVHEQLLHLIVVSKDLSYFNHIHPEYKGEGRFEIETAFPSGGDYQLISDFTPELKPDKSLVKVASDKEVTLSFDHLMAGMDLRMVFSIKDADTKLPVTDLQPYLGSLGHAVAISADSMDYVHVHPIEAQSSGPDAAFTIGFPESGMYRIWGQFQHNNKVFVVPFTVNIP